MRFFSLLAMLGLASASCFPSFDVKGSGGAGGAGTGQTSSSDVSVNATATSATSTGPGGGGGGGGVGPVPCNPSALGPLSVGSFALTDPVEITGLVAAGGNVFVAGHSTSGYDGSTAKAGTFLFWGPETGSTLFGMQLDPESNPPPQVALGVSQRNGVSYVEIVRAKPDHLNLYEIEAATFNSTSMNTSAGFAAECNGMGQSRLSPSLSTAEDGSVVLAFQRAPTANLPFSCDFGGATYDKSPPSNANDFVVLLGVHGSFPTPSMEVATPNGYQIEPRLAITSAPGAPFVLTTQAGTNPTMLQYSSAVFPWGVPGQTTDAGDVALGTTLRPAAVGSDGFIGGTVANGAGRKSLVQAVGGGAMVLDSSGVASDVRSVRDVHGGGSRLAVGGTTTSDTGGSSGLVVGGDTNTRLLCPASTVCSYAVSLDVSTNKPVVKKQASIEPTTSDIPTVAAVFSDSCGQTYAAGTFKAPALITTTGLGSMLTPTGQQSVFLVKLDN